MLKISPLVLLIPLVNIQTRTSVRAWSVVSWFKAWRSCPNFASDTTPPGIHKQINKLLFPLKSSKKAIGFSTISGGIEVN